VCPVNATPIDTQSGIVGQIYTRCIGCRYCQAACPYMTRVFNWQDPRWPHNMKNYLNPDVSVRMRGVVEKCSFCHHRLQKAKSRAIVQGKTIIEDHEYVPACTEACPSHAISFGNLLNPDSEITRLTKDPRTFRILEQLGSDPKVFYMSKQQWIKKLCTRYHGQKINS